MDDIDRGECIAWYEKNSKEEVRASVDVFRGRPLINIRVFYKDADGSWKPGKQGLAVAVERYRDLANLVLEVGEHLQAKGHLTP